ncbi:ABC transporter permease [Candidatus Enterococcus ikei]|uniref:FtsX-like permease family protein n=1 Tax=Candidatus Enterococcus ikei TaxID=2815326 RepID=A0ABS3H1R4_9ENTE|nr:ABC transporter permease [Enterococcus sp. DIV0869a]MBO0441447.1 FtsX-like permease family protein [Enterococcus sp. DIV0869a]
MRTFLLLLRKNLFKRKAFAFSIVALSAIAIIFLLTTLGSLSENGKTYDTSYEASKSPDLLFSFSQNNYRKSYTSELKKMDNIKNIETIETYSGLLEDEKNGDTNVLLRSQGINTFRVEDGGNGTLNVNETYVPIYLKDSLSLKKNDTIDVKLNSQIIQLKIVGFFEDTVFGSPIMRYNQVLINDGTYDQISKMDTSENIIKNFFIQVNFNKPPLDEDFTAYVTNKMENFEGTEIADFIYDKTFTKKAYVMIPTVLSLVLLLATAFIVFVSFFVLRYAILTSLESDYTQIGVMKALGFTNRKIKYQFMIQFHVLILLGGILGLLVSTQAIPRLTSVFLNSNGIIGDNSVPWGQMIVLLAVFILLNSLIILFSLRKLKNITPVKALRMGQLSDGDKGKKSISLDRLSILPLSISISIKQLSTRFKQYTSLMLVAFFFSFLLLSVLTLSKAFEKENEVFKLLGMPKNDVVLQIAETTEDKEETIRQLVKQIDEKYPVNSYSSFFQTSLKVEKQSMVALVYGDLKNKVDLSAGRYPKAENEILITSNVSEQFNKNVNDTLKVSTKKENSENFKIVGIYQSVNNVGLNIHMLDTGYSKLNKNYSSVQYVVDLENDSDISKTIKQFSTNKDNINITDGLKSNKNLIETIQTGLLLMTLVVLILSFSISSVIILLLSTISINRESLELGIMKSLGYTSAQLRCQFATRFVMATTFGTTFGIISALLGGNKMFSTLLSMAGLTSLDLKFSIGNLVFVVSFFVFVSFLFSYVSSRKIKNVNVKNLLVD